MRESPGGTRLPGGGGRAAKLSLKGGGMLLPSVTPLEPPPPPPMAAFCTSSHSQDQRWCPIPGDTKVKGQSSEQIIES